MDCLIPRASWLLVLIALGVPGAHAGPVYKWVDEHGHVQYGDRPPASGAAKVEVDPTPAPDSGLAHEQTTQQKLLDSYDADTKDKKQHDDAALARDKVRRANCEKVKKDAEDMRNARFLYESTADPDNPRVLSDEERAAATRKTEAAVSKWCAPASSQP